MAAVLLFRSSDALAGAYGIAVSGLMAISTFLAALIKDYSSALFRR